MNPSGATFVTKRDANRQENHGVRTDRALNTQWPLPDLCHHSEYRIYVNGQYVENAGSVGLNTAMRDSEMRHLTWGQIDFLKQVLTVGKSKTAAGTGRTIPLNSSVLVALADHMRWYEKKVGPATAESYVFPFGKARHYDAKSPIKTFKKRSP